MNIKKKLFEIINKTINEKYQNHSKKYIVKYSNYYYLENIFMMLNDINKWVTLTHLNTYKPMLKNNNLIPKYHFSVVKLLFL